MTKMDSITTNEEILEDVTRIFIENFDLEEGDIKLEAKLYDDFDIDSMVAVDLMLALKKKTGNSLGPDALKRVHTVGDTVEVAHDLLTR